MQQTSDQAAPNAPAPIPLPSPVDAIALPEIAAGAKSFTWLLGEEQVTISRLKTNAALATVKTLMGYLDKIVSVQSALGQGEGETAIATIQALAEVLDPDELLSLGARLMGLPKEQVGEAPLEDVLAAMAGAIDLNRVPTLIKTIQVLGQKLGIGRG